MNSAWIWVDSPHQIPDMIRGVKNSSLICLDTEYDSFRYFFDKLCLIQINTGEVTYLVDPIKGLDLSFLGEVFLSPNVLKVMHAGDNDIRLLKRDYGFCFKNIFDTHRAASMLGCHYLALSTLITQFLGIEFIKKKKIQRSQWDIRPLSEQQLDYAVQDTAYLSALYKVLDNDIRAKGLKEEADKHFEHIASLTWHEKDLDPQGHRKIQGYSSLNAEQKKRLKNVYAWRYKKAREINRAVFMIISNANLIELSRAEIRTIDDLREIMPSEKVSQFSSDLMGVINVI
jgi:ribonuclease D